MENKPVWDHEAARNIAHEDTLSHFMISISLTIKPDVLTDNNPNLLKIIEVSVPNDYGFNCAESEKKKYQDLKNVP